MRRRIIDVTELRRAPVSEVDTSRPPRERLRASIGERSIAKQVDEAEAERQRSVGRERP